MSKELAKFDKAAGLSVSEKRLLDELLKPDSTVEVVIPDDINQETFLKTLTVVTRSIVRVEAQRDMLLPVLGRLMLVAKEHPETWKGRYARYQDFVAAIESEFGVGRSTAYLARQIAESLSSQLEIKDYQDIGTVKLRMLSQVIEPESNSNEDSRELIEQAKVLSVKGFREHLEDKGLLGEGESTGASISIPCSKRLLSDWRKFKADPQVQEKSGGIDEGKIMDAMIAEFQASLGGKTEQPRGVRMEVSTELAVFVGEWAAGKLIADSEGNLSFTTGEGRGIDLTPAPELSFVVED